MLEASQVLYDGRWSQVGRLHDESGRTHIRKVSKYTLQAEGLAVLEFLETLSAHPHPNLLIPERFSGGVGKPLVEDYPDLSDQPRLDKVAFTVRGELAKGELRVNDVIDFMGQLSDAVGYIHRGGFVHQDVRARNVFIRRDGGRLIPTLFDYTFLVKHFFLVEGRLVADLEAPPEVRVGYVVVDGRYDVYQLGWMLRSLTHYEAGPGIWRPVTTLGEGVEAVIERATSSFGERPPNADLFREDLARLTHLG